MARKEIIDLLEKYVAPFRITKGEGFRLKDINPNCSSAALPGSRRSRKCSMPGAAVPC